MRKVKFYCTSRHFKKTYVYYATFSDEATVLDIQKAYNNWLKKIIDAGWEDVS